MKVTGSRRAEADVALASALQTIIYVHQDEDHLLNAKYSDFVRWVAVLKLMVGATNTPHTYFQHAHFIPIVGVGKRGEY